MDDLNTLASARRDPKGFVEALPTRAFLDEVQRAPEVFLPIKAAADRDRRPGRFVLTGSANVLALPRVSDSLAGRMEILTLWPLAQAEIEGTSPGFIDACFSGQAGSLQARAGRGRLFSSACSVMELMKLAANSQARPSLFHFRTSSGQEVDVAMETRRRDLVGVEIKSAATMADADFRGLHNFAAIAGKRLRAGIVLYAGRETLPFGDRMWAVPLEALWAENRSVP
jgi:predicted AAA+ superfamily ATPase